MNKIDRYSYIDINGNITRKKNNSIHNDDGPAVEWVEGPTFFFIDGRNYPLDEWCDKMGISEEIQTFYTLKYMDD
jgi:hypothetical protein